MITLNINGQEIQCEPGLTILQAARQYNIEIPTLCHDERVKNYGACGICVVEVEGSPKLVRSCSVEAAPGMVIQTDTEKVIASRKVTLDFILSDHTGDCRPPCTKACPGNTDCQGYVGLIANGEYQEALKLIKEQLPLPASVGLVCPHPCETACRRQLVEEPVAIAALKVFAAENDLNSGQFFIPEMKPASGKRVAVIGSGPAGLTAAYFLTIVGHAVTIYESMPQPGGMLRYGIPEYRLPKKILDQEIEIIKSMGVQLVVNTKIGKDISLEDIRNQNDAVFLGIGAWKYSRIGCSGEDLPEVIGGIDFLRGVALNQPEPIGARVAVIGGGNTAMDAARTAVRLGAKKVMVLYRRTRDEMPAEDLEIHEAMEEGIEFNFLVAPDSILEENGKVSAIRMQKMELGPVDSSGRRSPVPMPGKIETIEVDTIIAAIGQQVDMTGFSEVGASRWQTIAIDDNSFMTNLPGVFAGGDGVTGPGIAIAAVGQGKKAADVMDSYLAGNAIPYRAPYLVENQDLTEADFEQIKPVDRVIIKIEDPVERRQNFLEVAGRMSAEDASREGNRCLECGCRDYFECKLIKYANQYNADPNYIKGAKHRLMDTDQHPFIERDTAKCILCGLCVRICDEVMGVNALGLVERGFDTVVQPEFGMPLRKTACISCGQCVSVCPTGALLEKSPLIKNIPLRATETNTTCSFCGLGCQQIACSHGHLVIRMLPAEKEVLCSKGRFGFGGYFGPRLETPLQKINGVLTECSWAEAYEHISQRIQAGFKKGEQSAALFAAPNLTMEEAVAASELGQNVLGTSNLGSFTDDVSRRLKNLWGISLPAHSSDEVESSDLILMVGSFNENQVMPVSVRRAVNQGAKLIVLSQEPSLVDELADLRICPGQDENSTQLLREVLAATVNVNSVDHERIKDKSGYKALLAELQSIVPGEIALKIAAMYLEAKSPMIIIDGFLATAEAVNSLADLALIGVPKDSLRSNGIMVVSPGANAAGLWQAGFRSDTRELIAALVDREVKNVFVLGEDPVGGGAIDPTVLESIELLVVLSPFSTATAMLADVVLPASTPLETNGHYLSSTGRKSELNQILTPPSGKDNLQILRELINAINAKTKDLSLNVNVPNRDLEETKAQFIIAAESPLFAKTPLMNPALSWFRLQAN
jgi:formate dehydrogenase major subunit